MDEDHIRHLQSLGFTEAGSVAALHSANGNIQFATYLLLQERSNLWPYTPNIPLITLLRREVGSEIDCRDDVGRIYRAEIKRKNTETGDWLIHYQNWDPKWDEWVNPLAEAWRFSPCDTLIKRLVNRPELRFLKCGDFIDINPRHHPGWKPGQIKNMLRNKDGSLKSGQVQVQYDALGRKFRYWVHLDNPAEVAPYSSISHLNSASLRSEYRITNEFFHLREFPQDTRTLRQAVDKVEKVLRNLRDRLQEQEEKDEVCNICMDRYKETALVPCGHRYCDICPANFEVCPLCSKTFTDVLKIF